MEFKEIQNRALEIRKKYKQLEIAKYGKEWSSAQIAEGFVGDVGDLMKLVLAKEGVRDIDGVDEKMSHELSDCLWSIMVLANEYDIDLENEFLKNMDKLSDKINNVNL